jgi:hypothetical protein
MTHSALIASIATALATSVVLAQNQPTLRIASPGEGAYVSGPTLLQAIVEPPTGVASVVFYADGKQVCTMQRAPYQCDWDAGGPVIEHQIRVVATLADGTRVVKTSRTKGAEFTETSEVSLVQVTVSVTKDGEFVHGLPQTAFRVYEDGVAQKLSGFSDSRLGLELIVAVDASGSMGAVMPKVKTAVM